MIKRILLLMIYLIFISCSSNSSISGANTGDAKQENGQVIGYVYEKLDHMTVPVNNAKVTIVETGKEYSQAYKKSLQTNSKGLYSFYKDSNDFLIPGTYNLIAEYGNKFAYLRKGVVITNNGDNDSCSILELEFLDSSKTKFDISGIINDSTNLDSGFIVFLGTNQNNVYFDSLGNVSFNNVPKGIYDIKINIHTNNNTFIIDTTIAIPTEDSLITISELDYYSDSLIIYNILSSNNIDTVQVSSLIEITDNRITSLDLSNLSIEFIPDSIYHLNHLETLIMKYSKMQMIPTSLCKLEKLKVLDISYNQIDSIPIDIGLLKELEYLNISGNQPLKRLPETITKLANLEILLLNDCYNLINLPYSIGNMENLQTLSCSANLKLSEIPAGIGFLSNLSSLIITHSQIETLSSEIGNLKSLKELILDNNHLSSLPDEIVNLTSFKPGGLSLKRNYLKNIVNEDIINWANTYDPEWIATQYSE